MNGPYIKSREQHVILLNERSQLALLKRKHETQLMAIKNLIRSGGRMSANKYKECCDAQNKHNGAIHDAEIRLCEIKNHLREFAAFENEAKALSECSESKDVKSEGAPELVKELCDLRQYYQTFSEDLTRVASMRVMASEFTGKLNSIIRKNINGPSD